MKHSVIKLIILSSLMFLANSFDKQKDCKCRLAVSKKIVQGYDATTGKYPWQLTLQKKNFVNFPFFMNSLISDKSKLSKHICSSILLNNEWALTAAHCLLNLTIDQAEVGGGDIDLLNIFNNRNYIKIEKFISHENFSDIDDIALIKFEKPVKFSKYLQPACISDYDTQFYNGDLKITGWGSKYPVMKNQKTGKIQKTLTSQFLQVGDFKDMSDTIDECRLKNQDKICVDNSLKDENSCNGDSGGPLHWFKNGKIQVIGIVSHDLYSKEIKFTNVCEGPTICTRISHHISWIQKHIGNNYCT